MGEPARVFKYDLISHPQMDLLRGQQDILSWKRVDLGVWICGLVKERKTKSSKLVLGFPWNQIWNSEILRREAQPVFMAETDSRKISQSHTTSKMCILQYFAIFSSRKSVIWSHFVLKNKGKAGFCAWNFAYLQSSEKKNFKRNFLLCLIFPFLIWFLMARVFRAMFS